MVITTALYRPNVAGSNLTMSRKLYDLKPQLSLTHLRIDVLLSTEMSCLIKFLHALKSNMFQVLFMCEKISLTVV